MAGNQNNSPATAKNRVEEVQYCDFMYVYREIVEKVEQVTPDEEQPLNLVEFYEVFGNSTRIKMPYVFSRSGMCVCDIITLLRMEQSAISHQLRMLKWMRLVKFRRDGKTVFYSLASGHIETIPVQSMEHIEG